MESGGSGQFDAGVAGKAKNGRWQVILAEGAKDPREGDRTANGRTEDFLTQWGYTPFSGTSGNSIQGTVEVSRYYGHLF